MPARSAVLATNPPNCAAVWRIRVTASSTPFTSIEAWPWRTSMAPVGSTDGIGVPSDTSARAPPAPEASRRAMAGAGAAEGAVGADWSTTASRSAWASSRPATLPTLAAASLRIVEAVDIGFSATRDAESQAENARTASDN